MRGFFRTFLLVIGVLSIALGIWWVLQGTGIVPVGFMAHHMQWAYRGAVLAVFGIVISIVSRRI
ncbi:MAG TPA: hypothetical protein VJ476_12220 [Rhizomicrobium sp.]|nr:hypothetical protein [Rhizomicrobium sp.]